MLIILATHALADADDMMMGFAARCGLRPRGRKDDDVAVPLDVALERALAVAATWTGSCGATRRSSVSRKSAVDSVLFTFT